MVRWTLPAIGRRMVRAASGGTPRRELVVQVIAREQSHDLCGSGRNATFPRRLVELVTDVRSRLHAQPLAAAVGPKNTQPRAANRGPIASKAWLFSIPGALP